MTDKRKVEDSELKSAKKQRVEDDKVIVPEQKKAVAINLKGRKPQVINEGEVYCGRNMFMGGWKLKASKWANPYKVGKDGALKDVLDKYKEYLLGKKELVDSLHELQGMKLACWCKPAGCHCDVLAAFANELGEKKASPTNKEKIKDNGDEKKDNKEKTKKDKENETSKKDK